LVIYLFAVWVDWIVTSLNMENIALINLTSIITAGAVVGAPLVYVIKRWLTTNTQRKEVSQSLHDELKNGLEALDGTSKRQVMKIQIKGLNKYYTLTFMNYDMYDSLINSGQIQALNHELQQEIQDIFRRIKGHKKYLEETFHLRNVASINKTNVDDITNGYYSAIADYETELEDLIPKAMKKLEKNF